MSRPKGLDLHGMIYKVRLEGKPKYESLQLNEIGILPQNSKLKTDPYFPIQEMQTQLL